jgi:aminoglycoside phosphotransferase (APT) family kinase protein
MNAQLFTEITMLYDATAKNACFVAGRPPEGIHDILTWARQELGLNDFPRWRLISARRKLGRVLFEVEEESGDGARRLIGKLGKEERAVVLYDTLKQLRGIGFAPPARHTVPEPAGFSRSRGFVLQEKAPGVQAKDFLISGGAEAQAAARDCAEWLSALHRCGVDAPVSRPDGQAVWTWAAELIGELPCESRRIRRTADAIFRELSQPETPVLPSHGDYHPMNVFIDGDQRVTAFDIDKFALREPEADIGWFLMQTAAFDFFGNGSFQTTRDARITFLEHYRENAPHEVRGRRIAMYMTMAFLKNLHFELVLMKTGRTQYATPWLSAASAAILDNDLHLVR